MLTEKDIEYIYQHFNSTPAAHDCGQVCAPQNDGIPFCCDSEWLIPVMYEKEFAYLQGMTNLWKRFKPRTKQEQKLIEETDESAVFVECLGHTKCERQFRSVSCRLFPFEPYLDLQNNFLGLTYNYKLGKKCPLVDKPDIVSKEFISEQIEMWRYIFEKEPTELDVYHDQSIQTRRYASRMKKPLYIFTPEGYSIGPYRLR